MTKINSLIIVHETSRFKILMINVEIRGVATLKVVAVPAISEKRLSNQLTCPKVRLFYFSTAADMLLSIFDSAFF